MPNLSYKSHNDLLAAWGANLTIGLLYGAPSPDGVDVQEPDAAQGYVRQGVTLSVEQAEGVTYLTNTNAVLFGPATGTDWQPADYFGLFDAAGDLLLYGRTRSTRTVTTAVGTGFPIGDIQLRLR